MVEVIVRIEFVTPCLGLNKDKAGVRRFLKDPTTDQVIFMQSWWRKCLEYGADAISKHRDLVRSVQAELVVDGAVSIYERFYKDHGIPGKQEHEAFLPGTAVAVNFMLPNELPITDFSDMLELAGRFVGISPYGYREEYGRFRVIEVRQRPAICQNPQLSRSGEAGT